MSAAIKEIPMLFSGEMVRAILSGSKTETRRLKFAGKVGDLIWVRETWKPHSVYSALKPRDLPKSPVFYRADNAYSPDTRWIPGIHMPRWVSRIALRVTAVRSEPLGMVRDPDAIAEGCAGGHGSIPNYPYSASPLEHFQHVWMSINGGAFKTDTVVRVIQFERVGVSETLPVKPEVAKKIIGLKMAKASNTDLEKAMELSRAFEDMTTWHGASVPQKCAKPIGNDEYEELDQDNHDQCQRILKHLMGLTRGLSRVVWGCAVMLDPENHFVDQSEDTIEYCPPKAKPLVWVDCNSHPYAVRPYSRNVWRALHWLFDENLEKWLMTFFPEAFTSEADAKAACEAHHQAAYREQSL